MTELVAIILLSISGGLIVIGLIGIVICKIGMIRCDKNIYKCHKKIEILDGALDSDLGIDEYLKSIPESEDQQELIAERKFKKMICDDDLSIKEASTFMKTKIEKRVCKEEIRYYKEHPSCHPIEVSVRPADSIFKDILSETVYFKSIPYQYFKENGLFRVLDAGGNSEQLFSEEVFYRNFKIIL